ncbi:MAG: hypothetical protein LBT53_00320 [Puniceicoccales bacterium]|nr:hypothetical protein [Puniceicoccales bacterium]
MRESGDAPVAGQRKNGLRGRATAAISRLAQHTRANMKTKAFLALTAAALAAAPAALEAQSLQTIMAPLSVSARSSFESEYVWRGKEHSDANLQTIIRAQYHLPTTSFGSAIYAGAIAVTPIEQTANFFDYTAGAQFSTDIFTIDASWIYHSFPNQNEHGLPLGGEQWELVNRPVYNRSNEVTLGVGTEYEEFKFGARVYYDFNLEQLTWEADIKRSFTWATLPAVSLDLGVFAGYVVGWRANGDQRAAGVAKWRNDYGYVGATADLSYQVRENITIGTGVRFAWNNDGDWRSDARLRGNTESNLWWGIWVRFSN